MIAEEPLLVGAINATEAEELDGVMPFIVGLLGANAFDVVITLSVPE